MILPPGVYIAQSLGPPSPPPEPCTLLCPVGHLFPGTTEEIGTRCRFCIREAHDQWLLDITQTRSLYR